jgi:hypothetical protein
MNISHSKINDNHKMNKLKFKSIIKIIICSIPFLTLLIVS